VSAPWTSSDERLALLLAGCRAACRRRVAELETDARPLDPSAGLPPAVRAAARRCVDTEIDTILAEIRSRGWRWIVPGDEGYPELLQATADPPLGLFVRGRLIDTPAVAIVGSRRATPYGLQAARLLAESCASAGAVVVSGMARGVDRVAHEGAVASGGTTWAVWGAGPDRVYPAEHGALADRIVDSGGALLTEYPPGTPPRRHHFPERNRIVAGLVRSVVVVEAAARSGALVTARLALDEGREVMAVPGSILSDLSVGPNALLRLGARPVVTPRDVLETLGLEADGVARPAGVEQDDVLAAVTPGDAVDVDALVERTGRPAHELTARLLELEIAGHVVRQVDGRYRRTVATPAAE
jgi:DNA processing protein